MTVPLRDATPATVAALRARLLDGAAPLAARYRARFALRNIAGREAEGALVDGEGERARGASERARFGECGRRARPPRRLG